MDLDDVHRMILEGRAAEAEARLRDDPRDPWALYRLADVILLQSPDQIERIEEAIDLYRKAEMRFGSAKEESLAKCARAKAVAMLALVEHSKPQVAKPDPLLDTLKQCGFESFLPGERGAIETLMAGGHVFAVRPRRAQLVKDLAELMVDGPVATLTDTSAPPSGEWRLLIVENAHRAAEGAPDFDPRMAAAVASVKTRSILAMVGAVTPSVRAEAVLKLGLPKPFQLSGSLDLPGVTLSVIETRDKAASRATVPAGAVIFDVYPASLEEFYEKAAPTKGEAVILFDPADRAVHHAALDEQYPDEPTLAATWTKIGPGKYEKGGVIAESDKVNLRRHLAEERLRAIERYIETRACRRRTLLSYFGETPPAGWSCSGCDRCKAAPAPDDIIHAVMEAVRSLQSRRLTLSDMSRGILFMGPTESIKALKGKTETDVKNILQALAREGRIDVDPRSQQVKVRPGAG